MESDGSPKKKKSRFFSGGKAIMETVQSAFHNQPTVPAHNRPPSLLKSGSNASSGTQSLSFEKATSSKTQETSFEAASSAFGGGKVNKSDAQSTNADTGFSVPIAEQNNSAASARVSTATSALQNLTFDNGETRHHGIGSHTSQQADHRPSSSSSNAAHQVQSGQATAAGGTPHVMWMFSAASQLLPRPPSPPRTVKDSAGSNRADDLSQNPAARHGLLRLTHPPRSQPNLFQPHYLVLPPREDPQKPVRFGSNLLQAFRRRPFDPNRDGRNAVPLRPATNIPNQGITNLPLHATLRPSRRRRPQPVYGYPPNLYMSPNRVPNAVAASRKRKRQGFVLPPPAYIYTRTNDPHFNILAGFLLYPELCFHLAAQLRVNDLVGLYAISKDFHTIIDTRFTTMILSQSLAKAPESSRAFPFRCYAHLCRKDPAARIPHPDPQKAAAGLVRAVPSFRWLRMILYREKVVHEIVAIMAEDGVPLPSRCALALKRMWFILDIPDNARRIGYIHSNQLVTDLDLYFCMCFFVKLDMRFNDPVAQEVKHGLRKMALSQPSLSFLLKALKRQVLKNQYEVMKTWIRYKYSAAADEVGLPIFGIAANEVGRLKFEYWGKRTQEQLEREVQLLLRPDQLVMREAIRRGMRFHKHFLRCLLYGYVRPDTMENYAPRDLTRKIPGLEEEYEVDDDVGGAWVPPRRLGDPILDLGERKEISLLCMKGEKDMDADDARKRRREEEFLEKCMEWSRDESEWAYDRMETD